MSETSCGNCKNWGVWEWIEDQYRLQVPCCNCAENKNWNWNGRRCLGVSGISANEYREQTVEEFAWLIFNIIKPRYDMNIEEDREEFNDYLNKLPDDVKSEYKKFCES